MPRSCTVSRCRRETKFGESVVDDDTHGDAGDPDRIDNVTQCMLANQHWELGANGFVIRKMFAVGTNGAC